MKKRYLPFGYRMEDGSIVVSLQEGQSVQFVFAEYLNGRSLRQIAAAMSARKIPYHSEDTKWNQNMVSRILANKTYCGNERYPAIISENQYKQVEILRQGKANTYSKILQPFRRDMQCGSCGARLYWRPKTEQWFCRQCGMWTKPIAEKSLADSIQEKMLLIQQLPQKIYPPKKSGNLQSVEALRLNREIQVAMREQGAENDSLVDKILHRAELQYELCSVGENNPITMQIKKACAEYEPDESFPLKFYKAIVSKVILYRDTKIEIELQNGQII